MRPSSILDSDILTSEGVVRYAAVFLIVSIGACNIDPLKGFDPNGPYIKFITVAANPTVVNAGQTFLASASAVFSQCFVPERIGMTYADQGADQTVGPAVGQNGTRSASSSFTAVFGQTVIRFHAFCTFMGSGVAGSADTSVVIQVAPAP